MYGEAGIACRPRDRQSVSSLFGDWGDLYGGPVPHRPAPEEPPVRRRPRLRLCGVRRRRHQAPVNGSCGKAKPTLPTS
ncbi:hypothetical protein SSAG_02602 [Streptomyces sp. Mg1]|nr:hypothetical protein SSAG_02602 [Streptomyces sp. Mg1]